MIRCREVVSAFVRAATVYLGNGKWFLLAGLETGCEESGHGHVCCTERARRADAKQQGQTGKSCDRYGEINSVTLNF